MKKYRFLFMSALFIGAFVYMTTKLPFLRRFGEAGSVGRLWSGPAVARGAGLGTDEVNNIDIYKTAHVATVNIASTVYRRNWFMQIIPDTGTGSGFLISADGKILTNNHVVSGQAPEVQVTLADKSRYKAEVLVRDPTNDLALIRVTPRGKLSFLPLGDSDAIQVGQKVLAIGNPFGLEGTLTTGIISSLGRTIADEQGRELEGMLQTDAAINPGNSGGPLLDSHGNVIAINTAILGPGGNIGIGFAMPINKAKAMLDDYSAGRRYRRPRLGVAVTYVAGDLAQAMELPAEGGLLIQDVSGGSAAEAAGLRGPRRWVVIGLNEVGIGGDLILAIDGKPVDRPDSLSRALSRKRAGDTVELLIFRAGRTTKVKVKLGAGPDE
ncbi:MAG: trypsin-like peptidase domain-containing protein [Acidobacteria bacterium]|nr:trypsin-like peptidase domain-containing protein [Acidobacteriota bacterium]